MTSRYAAVALAIATLGATARGAGPQKAPAPLAQSASRMTVPEGFHVNLFAGEPDVRKPIAFTFDARGRVWAVESEMYPFWEVNGKPGKDRVVIYEDTDGDGKFDTKKVFLDTGTNLTGLEVGFGGVWLTATPNFLFYPDKDGDDRPDGPPEVLLDGWNLKGEHNVFNGLVWAPDGWLWGTNGILCNSRVGKPGTPDADRVAINCGVWRFHPTTRKFEVVASGTTNPWGLDFDDYGEGFITNCVIPHLFHVIPGAHLQRMHGNDLTPNTYGLIQTCADHIHWGGGNWETSFGTEVDSKAGGGHAHSGAIVYLGDNWPDSYRNTLLTCNLHGNRVNHDTLKRSGSGYTASHGKDFLMANDSWFRGITVKAMPDGSVLLSDWSDTGECHDTDADGVHHETGRLYRISYGDPKPAPKVNLPAQTDAELVAHQASRNEWLVRMARKVLEERFAAGREMTSARTALKAMFATDKHETVQLRALWALNATGGVDPSMLTGLLASKNEHLRSWAIRLLTDDRQHSPANEIVATFADMAKSDPSAKVRLNLASALQRLPLERRPAVAEALMAHAEDAQDANLPHMIWYAVEPLVSGDLTRAADWAATAQIPRVRRSLAHRLVSAKLDEGLAAIVGRLNRDANLSPGAADILEGIADGIEGRRTIAQPPGWPVLADKLEAAGLAERTTRLSLVFGEPRAVKRLRSLMADRKAPESSRLNALTALAEVRVPGLAADLTTLLDDPILRRPAIRALAVYDDPSTPGALLSRFASLGEPEREDAMQTLAARPDWALTLLGAVEKGSVPRQSISVALARQIQTFKRKPIDEALARAWGSVRPTSGEKAAVMARYQALLTPEAVRAADPSRGRVVFEKTCLQCHKLYEAGGDIGPDLTGSNRDNLEYVLGNVIDPSAAVANDYKLTTVATHDGRFVSGIVRDRTDVAYVIRTLNERVVIPRAEVEEVTTAQASMMPEGLFETLSPDDVRNLVAYLAIKHQVPLPGASASVSAARNGATAPGRPSGGGAK